MGFKDFLVMPDEKLNLTLNDFHMIKNVVMRTKVHWTTLKLSTSLICEPILSVGRQHKKL